jgi:two-component system, OmpR family, alkaline phosphatase synthesis response regulator PhoP
MKASALVVDDDRLLLRLVELNLSKLGIKVILADNGQEALRLAQEERPDVILLDIMMPRMDGYEVIRQLKDSEETRAIPVIMLTAKSNLVDRRRCRELGAVEYITKPFRLEDLRNTVIRIIENSSGS